MKRSLYMNGYRKPSTLTYRGDVWCSWSAAQARQWITRDACIEKLMSNAMAYGETKFGANHFGKWQVDDTIRWGSPPVLGPNGIEFGSIRARAKAYYKS